MTPVCSAVWLTPHLPAQLCTGLCSRACTGRPVQSTTCTAMHAIGSYEHGHMHSQFRASFYSSPSPGPAISKCTSTDWYPSLTTKHIRESLRILSKGVDTEFINNRWDGWGGGGGALCIVYSTPYIGGLGVRPRSYTICSS